MLDSHTKTEIREFVEEVVQDLFKEKEVEKIKPPMIIVFENNNIQSLCVTCTLIDSTHMKIIVSPRTDVDKEGMVLIPPNAVVDLATIA